MYGLWLQITEITDCVGTYPRGHNDVLPPLHFPFCVTTHTRSHIQCARVMSRLGRFGVDRMMVLRTHLRRAPPILSRSACIDETLGCQVVLAPGEGREEIGYSAPGGRGGFLCVCV